MKPGEILDHMRSFAHFWNLPEGEDRARCFFYMLADSVPIARLNNGCRLIDGTDFIAWLRELGDAAKRLEDGESACPSGAKILPINSFMELGDSRCPRCNHLHQGVVQCGFDLGGGRLCRCELPVPA